jgi:hypothetical protein
MGLVESLKLLLGAVSSIILVLHIPQMTYQLINLSTYQPQIPNSKFPIPINQSTDQLINRPPLTFAPAL